MRVYPLNEEQRATLKEYIRDELKKGHIRPSTSPAGYPILFVPKKNGKLRLCVDYRQLNDITIKNRHPLPLIREIRDRLHGARWFTALDLRGAYNLIRMKEGEEWKTAFRTSEGHFEYLVMPFGLTNAPATFQVMINHVLREFLDQFAVAYLDDILIYSRTLEQHKEHVHKVLQALQDAKLQVDPEKCNFHTERVDYLGLTIEPGLVKMQDSKVQAVRDWPQPTNVKEVRGFLGFTNFYRRFIRAYSKIAAPLTDLTKGDGKDFQWKPSHQQAFETIKEAILKEPVLAMPDPDKPYEVETDASDFAIGGQLGQKDEEGRLHPIAFFSQKLSGPELNYQIHDKELMAIIQAFKEWKPHLSGTTHEVKVYTDHKNLTYFTTSKELNKRQTRWSEFLSEFNFRIIYRKGSENGRADALSRRADHEQTQAPECQAILRMNPDGSMEQGQKQISATDTTTPTFPEEFWDSIGAKTRRQNTPMIYAKFVKWFHEHPVNGHMGIAKTTKKLMKSYDFPKLRGIVKEVVNNCQQCQQNKASRHKPYGELKPLPIPKRAWGSIALDHIVKLPKSREPMTNAVYDSILVITDRLTKYGYFVPYKEASSAEELAYAFLRIIVANHGLPDEIVSDRGTTFASKFWQSLTSQLGVNHKLSTAYHPETDGQTERLNQTLEQYLRSYVNYQQDDWVIWLPLAQFAYNSAESEPIKCSPFFANYGFEPEIHRVPRQGLEVPKAVRQTEELKALHEQLRKELHFTQERMSKYANQKRLKGPTFREGSRVFLLRRNIKTRRPSDKLDHKKLGPFRVKKVISDVNYELDLPNTMKIHPIFHVSMLEPAPPNAELTEPVEVDPIEGEYEVEAILSSRKRGKTTEYLVKWLGYDESENTWEPIKHLTHCQQMLDQYHQQNPEQTTTQMSTRRYPTRGNPSPHPQEPPDSGVRR
jgi:hypothetical protein